LRRKVNLAETKADIGVTLALSTICHQPSDIVVSIVGCCKNML
jgi:hypothetical protein